MTWKGWYAVKQNNQPTNKHTLTQSYETALSITVIIIGNGVGNPSSNSEQGCLQ